MTSDPQDQTSDESSDDDSPGASPGQPSGDQPEPTTDETPAVGPGGVDAVADWEDAGPDAVVPDPPRSAQVESDKLPDEIDEPEGSEVSHDDDGSAVDEPAENAEESSKDTGEPAD